MRGETTMERKKKYVPVIARFEADGRLRPFLIEFEEGRRFPIDRILDVRRAASLKAGGAGIRYTVQIGRCKRFLYYDQPQWFVEGKD